jgi:hypothetical protein
MLVKINMLHEDIHAFLRSEVTEYLNTNGCHVYSGYIG